ncbi:hypothetical protein R6U76_19860 [Lysinibacillus capsici]|uniref:hypothetical protein n=1 Tax=Lysinibacillus capsici TaxID=2115968 RepID=UPI0029DE8E45|nr:hypothetical protein [Lysinibacillus capsici]WPK04857.1 hypothetical protein R6U76_19860 [Lysinibacillus capsici]
MAALYWSAKQGEYLKCPVEGCLHFGIVITNAHCRIEHQMSREEVQEKYGLPKKIPNFNRKQIEAKKTRSKGEA